MRVRYGKPTKLKSLLGKQDSLTFNTTYSGPSAYRTVADCEYIYTNGVGLNNYGHPFTNINLNASHYYVFIRLDTFAVTNTAEYSCNNDGSLTQHSGEYRNADTHYTVVKFTNTTEFRGWEAYRWGGNAWDDTMHPLAFSLIDLTEIGLDNLTAQQFYNKYNKYFPLIAAGEEITIDDKAGQIAYKNLEEDSIRCKVAGGSSDIYYGYNQLAINGDFANGKSSWDDWNSTTVVTNGVAEITRTNTSQSSLHQDISANPGDKIYVRATMWSDGTTPVRLGLNGGISWSGTATTSTTPVLFEVIKPVVSTGNGCRIELFGTGVANTKYYAKEVNAINLTTWFGAGKEPSTVQEFKEKFTKEYYGFCPTPIKLTRYQIEALPNYGYNQVFKIGSGNECARTYGDDGEFILTANASTTHTYFGLTCYGENYNLDSIKGHKALCIAEVVEISIVKFKDINFTWALSNITDRLNITEPGILYGIGTWGTSNQTFLNVSVVGTFTQGDYFKVKDVQIIDLTD